MTGAACCGKTILIDLLADQGFQTAPETARQYIDREIAWGPRLEEIFGDTTTQICMAEMQRRLEHGLRATDIVFLDLCWFLRPSRTVMVAMIGGAAAFAAGPGVAHSLWMPLAGGCLALTYHGAYLASGWAKNVRPVVR